MPSTLYYRTSSFLYHPLISYATFLSNNTILPFRNSSMSRITSSVTASLLFLSNNSLETVEPGNADEPLPFGAPYFDCD